MKRILLGVLALAVVVFGTSRNSSADVINGGFSTGLTGWTAEDLKSDFPFIVPGSAYVNPAGQAVLATQGQNSDIVMVSLSQWLAIPDWASTLSFDVWFETGVVPDGASDPLAFPDFFQVSYLDDLDLAYDQLFLGYDLYGPYDPLTFAPISLVAGYHFSVDISLLAGRAGTLYFDLVDEPDGWYSTATVDDVRINPVPEPATMVLFGSGLLGLAGLRRRNRERK